MFFDLILFPSFSYYLYQGNSRAYFICFSYVFCCLMSSVTKTIYFMFCLILMIVSGRRVYLVLDTLSWLETYVYMLHKFGTGSHISLIHYIIVIITIRSKEPRVKVQCLSGHLSVIFTALGSLLLPSL